MAFTVKLFGPSHVFLAERALVSLDEPVVFAGMGPCEVVSAEIVDSLGRALPLDIRSLPRPLNPGDTLSISPPSFTFSNV